MLPVWSPSGDKIAVTSDNYDGIWVADADGSNLRQVTAAQVPATRCNGTPTAQNCSAEPMWCPTIVFSTKLGGGNAADGAETTLVGKTRELTGTPLWNDAERVMISGRAWRIERQHTQPSSAHPRQPYDVYTMMVTYDPAGVADKVASLKEFSGAIIINPALSSNDGKQVAFQVPGKGIFTCNSGRQRRGLPVAAIRHGCSTICRLTPLSPIMAKVLLAPIIYAVDVATGKAVLLTANTDMIPLTPGFDTRWQTAVFENAKDACIYEITLKY